MKYQILCMWGSLPFPEALNPLKELGEITMCPASQQKPSHSGSIPMTGERSATQLYEYGDFDDKGNWTVRLIYVGEDKITPELVVIRELTYY